VYAKRGPSLEGSVIRVTGSSGLLSVGTEMKEGKRDNDWRPGREHKQEEKEHTTLTVSANARRNCEGSQIILA